MHAVVGSGSLVEPDWVAAHLDGPDIRVVEIDVSRAAFDAGHIPGAVFWNAYGDLRPVQYRPLSDEALAELVAASGIGRDTTVVVYGYAAYLGYWLLRAYGHRSVYLMDGPRERWTEAGHAFTAADGRSPAPAPAPAGANALASSSDDLVTREAVQALIGDRDAVLVDVRSAEEFRGERFWPSGATEGAGRAGRIPGAVWLPIEVFAGDQDAVREACEAAGVVPDRHAVVYCTIGNRASLAWYVLTHVLGYPRVSVYYGSWAEWGTAADTPVEVG